MGHYFLTPAPRYHLSTGVDGSPCLCLWSLRLCQVQRGHDWRCMTKRRDDIAHNPFPAYVCVGVPLGLHHKVCVCVGGAGGQLVCRGATIGLCGVPGSSLCGCSQRRGSRVARSTRKSSAFQASTWRKRQSTYTSASTVFLLTSIAKWMPTGNTMHALPGGDLRGLPPMVWGAQEEMKISENTAF